MVKFSLLFALVLLCCSGILANDSVAIGTSTSGSSAVGASAGSGSSGSSNGGATATGGATISFNPNDITLSSGTVTGVGNTTAGASTVSANIDANAITASGGATVTVNNGGFTPSNNTNLAGLGEICFLSEDDLETAGERQCAEGLYCGRCRTRTLQTGLIKGSCRACPTFCTQIYAPVCGSDGRTYTSDCSLAAAACEESGRQTLYKISDGECPQNETNECSEICTAIFDPVCGSDGNTYSNECFLRLLACRNPELDLTIASVGSCPSQNTTSECPEACPLILAPVCGSDGITYDNECLLRRADCLSAERNITVINDGPCNQTCPEACTQVLSPVCGSDGLTYGNPCYLKQAACTFNKTITQVFNGPCILLNSTGLEECPQICPAVIAPVCGADGQTYSNECILSLTDCRFPEFSITLLSQGECSENVTICPSFCPDIFAPVCGSNGITYENWCRLRQANCAVHTDIEIIIELNGFCANVTSSSEIQANNPNNANNANTEALPFPCPGPTSCIQEVDPVCGTDGVTYATECYLRQAACDDPASGLRVASPGFCP